MQDFGQDDGGNNDAANSTRPATTTTAARRGGGSRVPIATTTSTPNRKDLQRHSTFGHGVGLVKDVGSTTNRIKPPGVACLFGQKKRKHQ